MKTHTRLTSTAFLMYVELTGKHQMDAMAAQMPKVCSRVVSMPSAQKPWTRDWLCRAGHRIHVREGSAWARSRAAFVRSKTRSPLRSRRWPAGMTSPGRRHRYRSARRRAQTRHDQGSPRDICVLGRWSRQPQPCPGSRQSISPLPLNPAFAKHPAGMPSPARSTFILESVFGGLYLVRPTKERWAVWPTSGRTSCWGAGAGASVNKSGPRVGQGGMVSESSPSTAAVIPRLFIFPWRE
jgi:hypothetical protein